MIVAVFTGGGPADGRVERRPTPQLEFFFPGVAMRRMVTDDGEIPVEVEAPRVHRYRQRQRRPAALRSDIVFYDYAP